MIEQANDFFVVGGSMRPQARSYIERPADAELFERLLAGEFCYVLTARQMGKSSLMLRTKRYLAEQGVRSVVIDLTAIGTVGIDAWYLGLIAAIRTQLRLKVDATDWWNTYAELSAPQRWIAFLHDVAISNTNAPLVIFIDEIDTTLNMPFRDDFFAAIRSIYNNRATDSAFSRLTFALFGVAAPTDLIRDRARTPFNIGRRVTLGEVSLADAMPLQEKLDSCHPGAGAQILTRIFYWTDGHPYLTQKLCASAVEEQATNWNDAQVDTLVAANVLDEHVKDPNLTFVQDRVRGLPEPERRQLLRLYRRVLRGERVSDDDRSPIQNQLELTGLVKVTNGNLQVRNAIYRTVFDAPWIKATMPRDRQLQGAISSVVVALALVLIIALRIWFAPTPTDSLAQGYIKNFRATITPTAAADAAADKADDHTTRLDSLARLFALQDYRATQSALQLFYDELSPKQQQYLFERSDASDSTRMLIVARNILATLGAEPDGADLQLLNKIKYGLERSTSAEAKQLASMLDNWRKGRDAARRGNYDTAAIDYASVGDTVPNGLPALLYDRAVANIRRSTPDYTAALRDLNAMLEVAEAMPTPVPTTSTVPATITRPIVTATVEAASSTPSAEMTSTLQDDVGSGGERSLHATKRFRNEQQIRLAVANLIQNEAGLIQAYQSAVGQNIYPQLETMVIIAGGILPTTALDTNTTAISSTPQITSVIMSPTPSLPLIMGRINRGSVGVYKNSSRTNKDLLFYVNMNSEWYICNIDNGGYLIALDSCDKISARLGWVNSEFITLVTIATPTSKIDATSNVSVFVGNVYSTPTDGSVQCGTLFESAIYGSVEGLNGAGIPGARLRVRSSDDGNIFNITTGRGGVYTVGGLGCNTWTVQLLSVPDVLDFQANTVTVRNLNGGKFTTAEVRFKLQP